MENTFFKKMNVTEKMIFFSPLQIINFSNGDTKGEAGKLCKADRIELGSLLPGGVGRIGWGKLNLSVIRAITPRGCQLTSIYAHD
jgi:hypothetical protein